MHFFEKIILCGLLLLILKTADAQSTDEVQSIDITFNKTTSVVFPAVIKSVDRGSRDILAQKAKGVDNVLQLKAARNGFPQTNLTVITSDGLIHEFTVGYVREPTSLVVNIGESPEKPQDKPLLVFQTDLTETQMENYAKRIIDLRRSVRFASESDFKISLSLRGIYIKDNVIFYHFRVSNRSNINYDVDFLRFYIEDRQKVKRTASQEVEVKPLYVFGDAKKITGQSSEDVVYALEKFTIPDAKRLVIEMYEKNGGRNLNLSIKNKTIVNARLVD